MNRLSNQQRAIFRNKFASSLDAFLSDSRRQFALSRARKRERAEKRRERSRVVTRHCSRIVAKACADILPSGVVHCRANPDEIVGGREEKSNGFCEGAHPSRAKGSQASAASDD